MKASHSASPFLAVLSALALLGTVALTGCTATDLAGPDMAPEAPAVEDVDDYRPTPTNGSHNQGGDGGGTETGASHNEMNT